ncbi:MAG: transporter substrate-binding domain-containing protein [Pseudomonadota bacterium]
MITSLKTKKRKSLLLLFALACGLALPPAIDPAQAEELLVMTENFPPFNYSEDGRAAGFCSLAVREIMKRLGLGGAIQVLPWPRAYQLVQETKNAVLFSVARTEARENLFRWVGPLVKYDVSLFKRKNSPVVVGGLADARRYLVGVKKDTAGYQWLLANGFPRIQVDYTSEQFPLPRMLEEGRIDLWLMGAPSARFMAAKSGVDPESLESTLVIFQQELYIAFSKSTSDKVIASWDRVLREMKADGAHDRIMAAAGME